MITIGNLAGFAVACAVGGSARFLVTRLVAQRGQATFPLPTLIVNLSGAFLAGLFYTGVAGDAARLLLLIGFCGCYTTVSTFALETVRLARLGAPQSAALNVGLSLFGSLLAVVLGMNLGQALP
ncbi:CrcB family protein [Methylonatrum kenyense]|uniref:fluoride efflux transporter FluC n=1 Tax=Methylonatrum kenyense TaxID=455253 RepID=UPI0020C07A8C|nr:CrcB family protein [Methylonatrum kenyense]MCK8515585.1 CrcB family protein [Methylonatrum kenyense]